MNFAKGLFAENSLKSFFFGEKINTNLATKHSKIFTHQKKEEKS
jgi:hypothetical protein